MPSLKSATLGLAIFAVASISLGQSALAGPMMMSHSDKMTMQSCMGMSDQAMMHSHKCMAMMRKTNMSAADMHAMKTCMAMSHDAMMADQNCTSMMKAHGMM